jgi:hypothetical protein
VPIIATYNEDQPTEMEKQLLMSLVYFSNLDHEERDIMIHRINNCTDYKEFQRLQFQLEDRKESIHNVPNPSYRQIWDHILKIVR